MNDKEMNLAILNKLYEIADKVFNEGVNVKEGNYTASDLAKMKDSAFKDGYLKTEKKSYKNECNKQVEKDCFIAPMASVNVLSFVCSFCVVQIFALVAKFEKLASIGSKKRMFIKQKDNNEVLCTERTITPLANENVSERKETVSTAKVVAISIGVPSCLDIPSNNMRLDIAADKPLNAAVGDCLCGVGKVVHTLPLPPPRSKEMSELITYTNFYNTS